MTTSGARARVSSVREHWAFRYGIAIFLCAATIGLSFALRRAGISINLTIPVVLAVVLSAWYGGLGPGILTSIVFQITTIAYATPPPDTSIAKLAFGYFSVFSLYIFLVVSVSRLHNTQNRLSSQRDLLDVTLRSIGDGVIATDIRGNVSFINAPAEAITGWKSDEAIGKNASEVLKLVDETTDEGVRSPIADVLQDKMLPSASRRALSVGRSGRRVPIDASATPIRDPEHVVGAVVVLTDLTEQRAIERSRRKAEIMRTIVGAQEAERHRIARDLHDNLGQRMSALRMRIESLSSQCAEVPTISGMIKQVEVAAERIDRDLGFLAWELKPTELETLGLTDALGSFARDWSVRHGIAAEFHADFPGGGSSAPHFSTEIETNLYRIAQEALNNVRKHAGAENVSILLQQRGDRLILVIEDDGKGFVEEVAPPDPSEAPASHGLIGMKERAALLGGTLEVDSVPEQGTSIIAQLPVTTPKTGSLKMPPEILALSELDSSLAPDGGAGEKPVAKIVS